MIYGLFSLVSFLCGLIIGFFIGELKRKQQDVIMDDKTYRAVVNYLQKHKP